MQRIYVRFHLRDANPLTTYLSQMAQEVLSVIRCDTQLRTNTNSIGEKAHKRIGRINKTKQTSHGMTLKYGKPG